MAQASLILRNSETRTDYKWSKIELANMVLDESQIAGCYVLDVGPISNAYGDPQAFWTFCQHNPVLMRQLSRISFDDNLSCPVVRFFYKQLAQMDVSLEMSNTHNGALFTLGEAGISTNPSKPNGIYFKDLFSPPLAK